MNPENKGLSIGNCPELAQAGIHIICFSTSLSTLSFSIEIELKIKKVFYFKEKLEMLSFITVNEFWN